MARQQVPLLQDDTRDVFSLGLVPFEEHNATRLSGIIMPVPKCSGRGKAFPITTQPFLRALQRPECSHEVDSSLRRLRIHCFSPFIFFFFDELPHDIQQHQELTGAEEIWFPSPWMPV
ncbi:unnamed protein product [Menidia menidia]|uniref:(Atlantic silverside) hypothetical protein n=1 Tax=Menidia menidia TaxID=238744 RepID=A0A8S4AK18_9TELE|nr:unnamed protein product [Menidia menidia]